MSDRQPSEATTRQKIIASAVQLFSEQGFAATSLRSIIADAGVNLAAIHYHFGSKDDLIVEVLGEKIRPLNAERVRRLEELEAAQPKPSVEAILRCFVEPALRMSRDPDQSDVWKRLIARLHHDDPGLKGRLIPMFQPTGERFGLSLIQACPHLTSREVVWRFHLSVGGMLYLMSHLDRVDYFLKQIPFDGSESSAAGSTIDEAVHEFVTYVAGAFRADSTSAGLGAEAATERKDV